MRLSREMLAAAYDYLRTTDPFRSWKLPPATALVFKLTRKNGIFSSFRVEGEDMVIRVHEENNATPRILLSSIAHEMVHLRQELVGDREHHGPRFQRIAARICAIHGFDPEEF